MKIHPSSLEGMLEHSFKNFHAKGMDYICLHRSPEYTQKVYMLEGDVTKVPEVVNPHDHRYLFRTTVLAGEMEDIRWSRDVRDVKVRGLPVIGKVYNAFDYRTPLNGGDGFTYRGEETLYELRSNRLKPGQTLTTFSNRIHTIRMRSDKTVLMLEQFEDEMPVDQATSCWSQDTPSCSDSGLYEKFTEAEIVDRLKVIGYEVAA